MGSTRIGMVRMLVGALLLSASFVGGSAQAEDEPSKGATALGANELKLTTDRVVIFKDGYSLFVRKGTATADAKGDVHTFEVPDAAVLGTFWAFSSEQKLLGMKAEVVTDKATENEDSVCISMVELLRANQGTSVTLGLKDDKELHGVIVGVLERAPRKPSERVRSVTPLGTPHPGASEREILSEGGHMVMLRDTPRGRVVLPVAHVETIAADKLVVESNRQFESTIARKRLSISLGAEAAGKAATVHILYFAPGLRWIPTYRVSGALENSADVALQAELLNEAMDLKDVATDLVVGVPHFKFREVVSPLALEAKLRNALHRAAPQLMGQMAGNFSNVHFQSRGGEVHDHNTSSMEIAPELAAAGSDDLFVYSIPKLTLDKGGRATMPLWQQGVPLRHLYTLDLALGRDARGGKTYVKGGRVSGRGRPEGNAPLDLAKYLVWHQLELTNKSKVPWTTGAAITMRGWLPLGQDMLTYTSVGEKSLLPITVAVDVRAKYDERETKREPNAMNWDNNNYARITKSAKLSLKNYRDEKISTRIRLSMGGKVTSTSNNGAIRINDFRRDDWTNDHYAGRINNHSDVEWTLELEPGQEQVLTVAYEYFMR